MIKFDKVSKVFQGNVKAVDELCLEVEEGETVVLLGTSGSGKTTTMKMVNRLIEPSSGTIEIRGKDIMDQDAITLRRSIGYAIQHIGLFPHMTVGENIAVVPKMLNWDSARISSRVDDLLEMVGLGGDDFRDRFANQLSGGQKQRIGVARALAANPPIVLMDEPFGALDPITREQLQDEFLDLESEIKKTILFVTHDIFEAIKMGDRIALMDQGRLQQLASPVELVDKPANEFVENFLGQHRFQLSLMTRTIKSIVGKDSGSPLQEIEHDKQSYHLHFRNNIIEALDVFKTSGDSELPIFDGKKYAGKLQKKDLLSTMGDIISL